MTNNPYLVIPFAAWFLAQAVKFLSRALKGDMDWQLMYVSGGMPSAHSAVVVSLATTALVLGGWNSPLFGVTAIFAAVVMYDALGVRRMAGEHAIEFNKFLKESGSKRNLIREIRGHQPIEVIAGAVFGAIVAVLLARHYL